jgi:hypothetical protein
MPYKKLLLALIILSFLITPTQKSYAVFGLADVVTDPGHTVVSAGNAASSGITAGKSIWDKVQDGLAAAARAAMKRAIRSLTNQTVNWINSGFKGSPAFVTDPGQFFLNAADDAASQMLSETQLNRLCSPFKASVRLVLVKNYLSDQDNYTCTLSTLKNNYDAFVQDFNQGGWDGWFEMTQTSGGNPFSAYFSAQSSLFKKVNSNTNKYEKQIDQGRGFLSFEKCKKGTETTPGKIDEEIRKCMAFDTNESGEPYSYEECQAYVEENLPPVGECGKDDNQTVTPGSVIETQLEGALGTGLKQMELARSVDEIFSALITQLFERVLQSGKGLLDNNDPNDPNNTLPLPEPPFGAPVIQMNGLSPTYIQLNTTSVYRDAGAIAVDSVDGDITSQIVTTGTVNTLVSGTYRITYNVTNSAGKSAIPVTRIVIVGDDSVLPGEGGQCADTGEKYAGTLRAAMDAVIASNPSVANLPNIEVTRNGRDYKDNARQFLDLVAQYINSNGGGFNATADVLNGGSNTSTGDIVAIWKTGDEFMERYDAIQGDSTKTVGQASQTGFAGFIPLDCTASGGGNDCGCRTNTGGTEGGTCGDTCLEKGFTDKYQTEVRSATRQALAYLKAQGDDIGGLPNYESESAVARLRDRTIIILVSQGFNATKEISPDPYAGGEYFYPQVVNVWKSGDPDKTGYRITAGNSSIENAIGTGYCGGHSTFSGVDIIPTSCQLPPPGPTPNPNPGSGNAFISSVSPTTAKPGVTTITITGDNLTNQVSFYDGGGGRNTVLGTVNSAKTQTTVKVPDGQPIGNATVKIYQGNNIWSNGKLIKISETGGTGDVVATVKSFNASAGWGGNLAYNSTDNTWLVVSAGGTGKGTYGRIMKNDGTTIGSQITISSGDSGGPKVAYSKDINKYLVVWLEWDDADKTAVSQIKARFVNPDGTFSGSTFMVHADVSYPNDSSMAYSNSAMQYDSKNKKFVYVWQTGNPGRQSNLRTISTTGVVGGRINLTSSLSATYQEDGRGDPAVAIKESANEYCVVYGRGYSLNNVWNASLRARTVNALTGAIGPETVIVSDAGPSAIFNTVGVVYNSVNNKYLVNWTSSSGAKGRFMSSCNGSTAGATITLNPVSSAHSLTYNPRSNQYASIGQNGPNSGNTYVILNSNGIKVSEGIAFAGGYGNFSPTIAPNISDGTFAAASSLEYATTRFAPNLKP